MFKSSVKLTNDSPMPRRDFPAASRKGRDRHSPGSRSREPRASGGVILAGDAKSEETRSVGDSVRDTLKSAEVRGFAIICVTACVARLVVHFVRSGLAYDGSCSQSTPAARR